MISDLTERQAQILDYIRGYIGRHGYGPSREEIATAHNFSHQTASYYLKELRSKGHVDWKDNQARTLRVIEES